MIISQIQIFLTGSSFLIYGRERPVEKENPKIHFSLGIFIFIYEGEMPSINSWNQILLSWLFLSNIWRRKTCRKKKSFFFIHLIFLFIYEGEIPSINSWDQNFLNWLFLPNLWRRKTCRKKVNHFFFGNGLLR